MKTMLKIGRRAETTALAVIGAAAAAAVLATPALAGADATFNTALNAFTGFLEGSGGKIITVLSLAGGVVGLASGRFSLGQVAIPVGVGVGAGTGTRVVSAYQAENEQLRRQVNERATAPAPMPGPQAMYGPGSAAMYGNPGAAGPGIAPAPARLSEVKMVSFGTAETGPAAKVAKGSTVYTDSPNYLPANSFASAKVVVGVDASAGVNSQADPLPVVLRITGPARSVLQNGKLLTTKIQGCLINGAARGDLSSEKVYIKLQKMTCPQPGGRYAESEVKGFIAFGGKTGVRGRVVSREGSLAMQAFFAGLVGGAGTALNSAFTAPVATISANGNGGINHTPNLGNVGLRALGGGAQESGKDLSKYLIERAEQYQPVIEMPTGVDVEIVFLEGVYVRN